MPYDVKLPDIGEGIAEGEIVRWLVQPGQAVREDQPLVEVMTDKANVEIPSPRTGTIATLHAKEGEIVPVGAVIITIALENEATGVTPPRPDTHRADDAARWGDEGGATPTGPAPPHAPATATATAPPARVQATPAVRQLAKELGVALEGLRGSGPQGTITAADVRAVASPAGASTAPSAASEAETRVPLRGLRRLIADQMRRSIQTAAHFTFVAECDMTAVVEHRARAKERAAQQGIKLTYLAYVIRALIEPLKRYPTLNASLDDERGEIVLKRFYHVGIATQTPEGLTVPVIHDADRLGLMALAGAIERLAEAARAQRLKLDELKGGTFTITSTGQKGGVLATPILHHPQVAILGVHEIKKKPAVVDDRIVARDLCNLSLSLDHRVVDGAVGADFLYDVIHRLEHPDEWLNVGDLS
jgi:pyruvate dehydrogenase E2 component (dihydrolipoamide acetyltransferase)